MPDTSAFSYEGFKEKFKERSSNKQIIEGDYLASILVTNKDFILMLNMNDTKSVVNEGQLFKDYGLKFHVSLPEQDPEAFDEAWKIVRDTLMENEVATFKIIRPGLKMSTDPTQRGKDVTVYADGNPDKQAKDWEAIFQTMTERLTKARIPPGYKSISTTEKPERHLTDSHYVSYRYFNEKDVSKGWPEEDPCSGLKINVLDQLPNITYEKPQGNAQEGAKNLMNMFKQQ